MHRVIGKREIRRARGWIQILGLIVLMAALVGPFPARALSLIRDAELEHSLKKLAGPVMRSAGMGSNRIRILVINDLSLNAFVVDSRHIFLHSGLIQKLKNPAALQAVIAHELAHIANGHLTRRPANMRAANRLTAVGFALAIAAAAKGEAQAGFGLATGLSSTAQRNFFAHTRSEESSADQSALRYMARAGIDPAAMNEVLDIFRGQEALRPGRQDPYARTHPMSRDRIRAVKGYVAALKTKPSEPGKSDRYWYARMSAKLDGFLRNPGWVLRQKSAKGSSEIATLRRAIALHRSPKPKQALAEINKLIQMRPKDPFYRELRGQILLESRNANTAVQSYRQAVQLAPSEPLILSGLGRALLAVDTRSATSEALKVLARSRARDPGDPRLLRNLAVAHAKLGQRGLASVATAERFAVLGRFKDAKLHAERASGALPRGSTGWLRAQDVLVTSEAALRR